jgi:hypothetical protein
MPELDHLEDLYLKTRHDTDLWQSAQLANEDGTVKLEATIPPKEPTPDTGGTRTEAELKAMGLAYEDIGKRKEKTVESPEVQAVRQALAGQGKPTRDASDEFDRSWARSDTWIRMSRF